MSLQLTIQNVLARLDQFEVMEEYFGEPVVFGKFYANPFRQDNNPGCWFTMRSGVLIFCDYASRYYGDCIAICQYRLGLSLVPALKYLNKVYNLGLGYDDNEEITYNAPVINTDVYESNSSIPANIVYQRYEDFSDNDYFYQYHITKETLNKFNVIPCHKVWVTSNRGTETFNATALSPIYLYDFGQERYKMYRPLSKKPNTKWRANCNVLQGYTDYTEDLVIRTSSLKDVMVLTECGFLADAPHCENRLAQNRPNMVLLYDNDDTGVKYSLLHSELYGCPYILLPEIYHENKLLKDPSDFAKAFGLNYLTTLLNQLLNGHNVTKTREILV